MYTSICALNTGNSNKYREVQNVGNEDIMYKPLLNYIDVETLMDEVDF